jgi:hypothetical protein
MTERRPMCGAILKGRVLPDESDLDSEQQEKVHSECG